MVWRRSAPTGEFGAAFTQIDDRDRDLLEAIVVKNLPRAASSGIDTGSGDVALGGAMKRSGFAGRSVLNLVTTRAPRCSRPPVDYQWHLAALTNDAEAAAADAAASRCGLNLGGGEAPKARRRERA